MKLALATLVVTSSTVASSVSSGTVAVNNNNNNNEHLPTKSALPNQQVACIDINNSNKGGGRRFGGLGNLLSGLGKGFGLSPSQPEEGLVKETVEDVVVATTAGSSPGQQQQQQQLQLQRSTKPGKSGGAVAHGLNNFDLDDQLDPSIGSLVVEVPSSTPLKEVTPKDKDTPANSGEKAPPFGLGSIGGLGLSSTEDSGSVNGFLFGGGFGLGSVGGLGLSSSEGEAEVEPDGGVTLADLGINETETTMEGGGFNPVESSTDWDTFYGVGDHEGRYLGLDYGVEGTYEEILYVSDTEPSTGVDESEDPIMQELSAAAVDESAGDTAIRK